MTNTTSTNAQPASPTVPQRKDWTKPVIDILSLAIAEHNAGRTGDGLNGHKSG